MFRWTPEATREQRSASGGAQAAARADPAGAGLSHRRGPWPGRRRQLRLRRRGRLRRPSRATWPTGKTRNTGRSWRPSSSRSSARAARSSTRSESARQRAPSGSSIRSSVVSSAIVRSTASRGRTVAAKNRPALSFARVEVAVGMVRCADLVRLAQGDVRVAPVSSQPIDQVAERHQQPRWCSGPPCRPVRAGPPNPSAKPTMAPAMASTCPAAWPARPVRP